MMSAGLKKRVVRRRHWSLRRLGDGCRSGLCGSGTKGGKVSWRFENVSKHIYCCSLVSMLYHAEGYNSCQSIFRASRSFP